jgi:molybdenum cofactor cytidylyltransferase
MRIIALVPAAGESRRMGRPKLTLGLGNASVIQRVVSALERGGAESVMGVAGPTFADGAVQLANHARVEGAEVVHLPAPTADMRATVEFGLDALLDHGFAPADGLLLCPGDVPSLTADLVREVVRLFRTNSDRIVLPVHGERKGHPVALPWSLIGTIRDLGPGLGVNALIEMNRNRILAVPIADASPLDDLDTPEDYQRLLMATRGASRIV